MNILSTGNVFTEINLCKSPSTLIVGTNGAGKAQPLTSCVLTPDGFKKMSDVQVGDRVITQSGKATTVHSIHPQGEKEIVQILFKDGRVVECCSDHLWNIYSKWLSSERPTSSKPWSYQTISTDQLIVQLTKKKCYVPLALLENVDTPDSHLPLHPYLLGVLIGDGHFSTCIGITSADDEVFSNCEALLPEGVSFSKQYNLTRALQYGGRGSKTHLMREILKKLGLYGCVSHTKFIPEDYFSGSFEQRLELLRGLMDTDGYIFTKSNVSYSTTSKQLACDVQRLVWSLGGIANIREYVPKYTNARATYTVGIRYKNPSDLFRLTRKKLRGNSYQYKDQLRLEVKEVIRTKKSAPMQCITLTGDEKLYITDNYVVTHNSTMIEALTFVLYGKPFRNINKPQLINSITGKGLLVEVEFEIGKIKYMVRRGMKPNIFEIYQNGKMLNQNAGTRDDQDFLEKSILKLNYKSFSQIVVLGSANYVPFMQLPASQRRAVVEDLLDIQIFSVMNSLLKDKVATNKTQLSELLNKIALIEQKIELHSRHIDKMRANNDDLIERKRIKIEEHHGSVDQLEKDNQEVIAYLDSLSDKVTDAEQTALKQNKLSQMEDQLLDKSRKLQKEIKFFHDHDNCPTCRQGIDHDFKVETIQAREHKTKEVSDALEKIEQEIIKTSKRLTEITELNDEISKLNRKHSENNQQIAFYQRLINDLSEEIDNLQENVSQIHEETETNEQYEQELKQLNKIKEQSSHDKAVMDVASALLKDTGIKTRIIKQYVPVMNKLINKYLAAMDFFINFELDESFNDKIKSRFRDDFSYASFSEGEKLRIDLALMLTWRAIAKIRNSASTNILIMDEVFDSSLDAPGTEEFLKILESLTENGTSTFIISHKSDILADRFRSTIRFEKHGNFSRMV